MSHSAAWGVQSPEEWGLQSQSWVVTDCVSQCLSKQALRGCASCKHQRDRPAYSCQTQLMLPLTLSVDPESESGRLLLSGLLSTSPQSVWQLQRPNFYVSLA